MLVFQNYQATKRVFQHLVYIKNTNYKSNTKKAGKIQNNYTLGTERVPWNNILATFAWVLCCNRNINGWSTKNVCGGRGAHFNVIASPVKIIK